MTTQHAVEAFLHHTEDRELTADEVVAERKKGGNVEAMRARCTCGVVTRPASWQFVKFDVKHKHFARQRR